MPMWHRAEQISPEDRSSVFRLRVQLQENRRSLFLMTRFGTDAKLRGLPADRAFTAFKGGTCVMEQNEYKMGQTKQNRPVSVPR